MSDEEPTKEEIQAAIKVLQKAGFYVKKKGATSSRDDKYGEVTVEKGKFLPGEPLFILRANDILAAPTIYTYASLAVGSGLPDEFVKSVMGTRERFINWGLTHKVRNPD